MRRIKNGSINLVCSTWISLVNFFKLCFNCEKRGVTLKLPFFQIQMDRHRLAGGNNYVECVLGTIHKRRRLIFRGFWPPSLPLSPQLSLENRPKLPFFLPPSLPLKGDVVYGWSLIQYLFLMIIARQRTYLNQKFKSRNSKKVTP